MITLSGVGRRIGKRGAALSFFVVLDFAFCFGLLEVPRPLSSFYLWMDSIIPLTVWAAVWGITGLVCLVFMFLIHDTPAFMMAVGLKIGWGLLSLLGWVAGVADRGYLSAVIWLGFAALVFLIAGGIPSAPQRPVKRWRWTRFSP